jgi:hypothetical protein
MTDSSYLPPVRLEAERERTVAQLAEHFASDHLDTAEFERRLDRVYQSTTLEQLRELEADLPELEARTAVEPAEPGSRLPRAAESEVRDRQMVVAVLGGTERKGTWVPARSIDVLAIMGGVGLDFREARFAAGVTNVNILAIMGGVEILVPPGIRVESNGIGILGGFESLDQSAPPDAPTLRLTGAAIMGGVEIAERLPGESAKQRKVRQREEQRRLKRGGDT